MIVLIICILFNDDFKMIINYFGVNLFYLYYEVISYFVKWGVEYLLFDLFFVDWEEDGGQLFGYWVFW